MSYKPFDQKLFDENDLRARKVVKDFLEKYGYKVYNGTKYGIDLVVCKDDKIKFYAEVEVKRCWLKDTFPYPDVNVPYRKKKFFESNCKQVYILLNNYLTSFLVIKSDVILKSKVESRSNWYSPDGEKFFVVPYNKILTHVKVT